MQPHLIVGSDVIPGFRGVGAGKGAGGILRSGTHTALLLPSLPCAGHRVVIPVWVQRQKWVWKGIPSVWQVLVNSALEVLSVVRGVGLA